MQSQRKKSYDVYKYILGITDQGAEGTYWHISNKTENEFRYNFDPTIYGLNLKKTQPQDLIMKKKKIDYQIKVFFKRRTKLKKIF